MRRFALFVFSLLFVSQAAAQAGWDRYRPARLDTTIENHVYVLADLPPTEDEQLQFGAIAIDFPLLVELTFEDQVRPVSEDSRMLIQSRLVSRGVDSTFADLFVEEALFHEEKRAHWIPVQSGPLTDLRNLHSAGDMVTTYLQFVGFHRRTVGGAAGDITWVFTMNEFQ